MVLQRRRQYRTHHLRGSFIPSVLGSFDDQLVPHEYAESIEVDSKMDVGFQVVIKFLDVFPFLLLPPLLGLLEYAVEISLLVPLHEDLVIGFRLDFGQLIRAEHDLTGVSPLSAFELIHIST